MKKLNLDKFRCQCVYGSKNSKRLLFAVEGSGDQDFLCSFFANNVSKVSSLFKTDNIKVQNGKEHVISLMKNNHEEVKIIEDNTNVVWIHLVDQDFDKTDKTDELVITECRDLDSTILKYCFNDLLDTIPSAAKKDVMSAIKLCYHLGLFEKCCWPYKSKITPIDFKKLRSYSIFENNVWDKKNNDLDLNKLLRYYEITNPYFKTLVKKETILEDKEIKSSYNIKDNSWKTIEDFNSVFNYINGHEFAYFLVLMSESLFNCYSKDKNNPSKYINYLDKYSQCFELERKIRIDLGTKTGSLMKDSKVINEIINKINNYKRMYNITNG